MCHPTRLLADADRLVSAADLAQYGKLAVAVCKKYFNLAGVCLWQATGACMHSQTIGGGPCDTGARATSSPAITHPWACTPINCLFNRCG